MWQEENEKVVERSAAVITAFACKDPKIIQRMTKQ